MNEKRYRKLVKGVLAVLLACSMIWVGTSADQHNLLDRLGDKPITRQSVDAAYAAMRADEEYVRALLTTTEYVGKVQANPSPDKETMQAGECISLRQKRTKRSQPIDYDKKYRIRAVPCADAPKTKWDSKAGKVELEDKKKPDVYVVSDLIIGGHPHDGYLFVYEGKGGRDPDTRVPMHYKLELCCGTRDHPGHGTVR